MSLIDKKFKSYIFTGLKEMCSGCGACVHLCPKQALKMRPDEEGFLFPELNTEKCVQCGLCDCRCPEVNDQSNKETKQYCYIATTKHEEYYKDSASIGICTMLSDYVVEQGGIVYGAYLDESNWSVYHIRITDKPEVQKIRNSKYIQSNTKETYSEVKENLKQGKMVLYIGTPCQIAGLKSYLYKDYDNLYTIDLICHGVASPKLLPLEIKYWEKIFESKVRNFRFRSKRVFRLSNGGMVNFDIEKDGHLAHVERFASSSPTYHCFAYSGDGINHNLRLSCYQCSFKAVSRYGDITVGDPWFIKDNVIKEYKLKSQNVIRSLYSANTEKGYKLICHIASKLYQREYSFTETFVQPAVKYEKRYISTIRREVYLRLDFEDYGSLVESLFNCKLEEEHKMFVKQYRITELKDKVKQLIGYYKWKK